MRNHISQKYPIFTFVRTIFCGHNEFYYVMLCCNNNNNNNYRDCKNLVKSRRISDKVPNGKLQKIIVELRLEYSEQKLKEQMELQFDKIILNVLYIIFFNLRKFFGAFRLVL